MTRHAQPDGPASGSSARRRRRRSSSSGRAGLLRRVPRKRRKGAIEAAALGLRARGGGATFALLPDGVRRQPWAGPRLRLVVWLGFELGIAPLLGLSSRPSSRARSSASRSPPTTCSTASCCPRRAGGPRIELRGRRARGCARASTGTVQGVGFRPVRLPAGDRSSGSTGWVLNDERGVLVEVEGEAAAVDELPRAAACGGAAAGAWWRAVVRRERSRSRLGERGFAIRDERAGRGGRRARVAADTATCARLPRRAVRPGGPPPPLPVHQLHELRAAVHDRARRAVRPAAHDDGRLRRCATACRAEYDDPARPPLPRPAERVPRLRAVPALARPRRATELGVARRGAARRPRSARGGRDRRRSRASAATTSPAARTTRTPSRSCAPASTARTSRSR